MKLLFGQMLGLKKWRKSLTNKFHTPLALPGAYLLNSLQGDFIVTDKEWIPSAIEKVT